MWQGGNIAVASSAGRPLHWLQVLHRFLLDAACRFLAAMACLLGVLLQMSTLLACGDQEATLKLKMPGKLAGRDRLLRSTAKSPASTAFGDMVRRHCPAPEWMAAGSAHAVVASSVRAAAVKAQLYATAPRDPGLGLLPSPHCCCHLLHPPAEVRRKPGIGALHSCEGCNGKLAVVCCCWCINGRCSSSTGRLLVGRQLQLRYKPGLDCFAATIYVDCASSKLTLSLLPTLLMLSLSLQLLAARLCTH